MGKRRRLNRDKRKGHALWSQSQLLSLLYKPSQFTPEQHSRFAQHLVKVSRRHRLRLPSEAKQRVCSSCHEVLHYGENASMRFRNGIKIQTCLSCNTIRRVPYKAHSRKVKA